MLFEDLTEFDLFASCSKRSAGPSSQKKFDRSFKRVMHGLYAD